MTEATQRPLAGVWWQDPNDNRIHDAEGNDVLDHMTVTEIGRRVNNHDALIAALEAAYDQLPCVCGDNFETCDCAVAKVTAALSEASK